MSRQHDVCVIGAGLIGSAAAKYLASKGLSTALVGPTEEDGALGACYDEGRIYRISDPDPVWAHLAEASIREYAAIEEASSENFFQEVGFLAFGDPDTEYMQNSLKLMQSVGTEGHDFKVYKGSIALETAFPFLKLPAVEHDWLGVHSLKHGGHLSPRKMVRIQGKLAAQRGASRIQAEALKVTGNAIEGFIVETTGTSVKAKNVLIAAGAMSSVASNLLPPGQTQLDIELRTSQALLLEVSEEQEGMPSMIYSGKVDPDQTWYILPPIRYPDGRLYFKMGYDGYKISQAFGSANEVKEWLKAQQMMPEVELSARKHAKALFPTMKFTGHEKQVVCLSDITRTTPDGFRRPYIDFLAPGFAIATGGNGWAGKSADRIGWLASEMLTSPSKWADDDESKKHSPPDVFKAFPKKHSPSEAFATKHSPPEEFPTAFRARM